MSSLRVRIGEGSQPQPILLWDSIWSPLDGVADWAIAGTHETQNRGGRDRGRLCIPRSSSRCSQTGGFRTIIPCVIWSATPIRADGSATGVDVRTDLGETAMGSLLWIFERSPLTKDIRRWVEAIALEALQPLIFQRVAVRIDAQASAEFAINRCDLAIQVYARDGKKLFDDRFEDIWRQSVTSPKPLAFPNYPAR